MAWKRKEKELTQEEAVRMAKKEFTPFWFGSPPLLVGFNVKNQWLAFPLEKKFSDHRWLMFFVNPTDIAGQNATRYAHELLKRYSANNIGVIIAVMPHYSYLLEPRPIEAFIKKFQIDFPVVIDRDMRLSRSFEVKNTPSLILIEKNQRIFQFEREEITRDTEQALQTFLRKSDPGLSLLAVKDDIKLYSTEIPGIEFGRKYGRNFSTPGSFLQGTRPETMEPGEIFISGRWSQDENHIATSDPEATVGFHCPTNSFSITAQSMSKPLEPAKVVIEINNESAYDMFALEDLTFDEESKSIIRAEGPRLYHALTSLPEDKREVTLRFPTANRATLALYSIRFFNSGPR